jgi:hypothetical protein
MKDDTLGRREVKRGFAGVTESFHVAPIDGEHETEIRAS